MGYPLTDEIIGMKVRGLLDDDQPVHYILGSMHPSKLIPGGYDLGET